MVLISMAGQGQNDINELKSAVMQLVRALKGNRIDGREKKNKYTKYDASSSGLEKSYSALNKELEHQKQIFQDNSKVFTKLKADIQHMMKPILTLDHAFENMGKNLRANMKNVAEDQKKVISSTFDIFNNVLKSNSKKFDETLKEMAESQTGYMKALEKAEQLVRNTPKDNVSLYEGQKNALKSQLASLRGQMRNKSPSEKAALKKEADKKKAQLLVIQSEMDKEIKARDAYTQNIMQANKDLHDTAKRLYGATGGKESLNKIEFEKLKIGKATVEEFGKAREKLKENSASTITAAEASHKAFDKFKDSRNAAIAKMLKGTVTAVIEKSIPQMVQDFKARQYYGGNESLATQNVLANTGMSEAERQTLVGKNQTLFRVMGGGDQNAVFKGGTNTEFSRLQKKMQNDFGLYGKEAAEKITEFGTTLMKSGFKPTEQNLKQFADNIKIVSTVAGEAPDEIKGFYDQLQQTGQMAILQQAFSDKTDAERMDILKNNTIAVFTLNKSLGYTNEQIKEQNQRALKREHADLVGSIMEQVGIEGMVQEYNKRNPNKQVTPEDFARGQIVTGGDAASIQTLRNTLKGQGKSDADITTLFNQYGTGMRNVLATAGQQRQEARLASIAGGQAFGANTSGASASFISDVLGAKGGFAEDQNSAFNAVSQALGQGSNTAAGAAALQGRFAGQDLSKVSIDQVNKAADGITEALDKASKAAEQFTTQLDSIKANPVGAPAAGLFGAAKDYALLRIAEYGGGKILNGVKSLFGRGKILNGAKSLFGRGAAVVGEDAAAVGGTSLAATLGTSVSALGAGTIAAGVGAAAGTGALVGTGLNKAWDSTKYGQKVNDAIDALATNGIDAAVMKIKAMADPMYSMQLAATPKDKIVALQAHKAAFNYLMDSVGKDNLQQWDANKISNKNIQAEVKNGSLTFDDLQQAGASDAFIKSLGDSLDNNTDNDKVVELLKKINDGITKGNDQSKDHAEKQQYYFASKEAIDQRVNRFLKNDADINKSIRARIPSAS